MANLRSAMDSGFWDQNVSTPRTLDATARSIPGQVFPMDGSTASRALRIQQLSLLRNGFPLGIIPSLSPSFHNKDLGSFSLQSLFFQPATSNWWLGTVGQFRPKKLFSSIKTEFSNAGGVELRTFKEAAKHLLDKSLYSIGLCTQLSLSPSSSLLLSTERPGDKKQSRQKLMYYHELPDHDITLEAAWPELFIDQKGGYWEVPESVSLDLSSHVSESGLRYRFGVHKNSGHPKALSAINGDIPSALMPGISAKAAFSYERSKDFWRQKETKKDTMVKTERGWLWRPSYDSRLKEPHSAISGLFGGSCEAWFGGNSPGNGDISATTRSPVSADLFGSVNYTIQHGKFRSLYGDLSRLDARLDLCSASALAKKVFSVFNGHSLSSEESSVSSPRLNLILQQQVAGPIVFRVDSRFCLGSSSSEKQGLHMEDLVYSLNYSLRLLRSGKVMAWYSPKRKEGMVELRLFEF
ncbi:protein TRIGALACTOSYLDIACYLGLYCEROL 4, chloroplastic [Rutidosis leptorrhynchoides]|uniref:protein TRIGALACTOSYLDIACYLGLYCEROL 4, chloroplastic n=1 Tax=Rutidosis leptorrhynchoides TaxID=125765 RepID=UPI003A99B5AA